MNLAMAPSPTASHGSQPYGQPWSMKLAMAPSPTASHGSAPAKALRAVAGITHPPALVLTPNLALPLTHLVLAWH